jgi:hypothetical protein
METSPPLPIKKLAFLLVVEIYLPAFVRHTQKLDSLLEH